MAILPKFTTMARCSGGQVMKNSKSKFKLKFYVFYFTAIAYAMAMTVSGYIFVPVNFNLIFMV